MGTGTFTLRGPSPSTAVVTAPYTNLASGTYSLIFTSSNGCVSAPYPIVINPAPSPSTITSANVTVTQPTCTAGGSIVLNTTGLGTGTFTVRGPSPSTAVLTAPYTNLAAGIYSITFTNADGCVSAPYPVTINHAPSTLATPTVLPASQPNCYHSTGSVEIHNVVIGVTYTLTGCGITQSLTPTQPGGAGTPIYHNVFENLPPCTYSVVATKAGSCQSAPASVTINAVPAVPTVYTLGGGSCVGNYASALTLSDTDYHVNYQLQRDVNGTWTPVTTMAGTGGSISFGVQPAGTYRVVATSTTAGYCYTTTNSVTVIVCAPIEGCTLGYWKNHTDRWCSTYRTGTPYGSVFTSAPAELKYLTLQEALNLGGGGIYNLARQSVAALLNACSDQVNYNARYEGHISVLQYDVNHAFETGTAGSLASTLDGYNNEGCPLGGTRATTAPNATLGSAPLAERAMDIYPNPFTHQASIEFTLSKSEHYSVQVLDMSGRLVTRVATGVAEAGTPNRFQVSSSNMAEGIYMVRLVTDSSIQTKRLILRK
ncbi:hypothetical protein GCM10027511_10070 [Hymenobacter humi]